jgi:hypothetical protein
MTAGHDRLYVRPILLKWSTVLCAMLLPFVVIAMWDVIETRRLRTRMDSIAHDSGEGTTARKPLPPSDARAERYYRAAAALMDPLEGLDGQDNAQALTLVDRAADLPFTAFSPVEGPQLTAALVHLTRLCERRAEHLSATGDAEGAWASLYSAARLARTHSWAIVPRLESIKAVLAGPRPSDVARDRVMKAFADIDRPTGVADIIRRHRAMFLQESSAEVNRPATVTAYLGHPYHVHLIVSQLDAYAAVLAAGSSIGKPPLIDVNAFSRSLKQNAVTVRCAHQLVAGDVRDCQ